MNSTSRLFLKKIDPKKMKKVYFLFFLFLSAFTYAQNNGPKEITPQLLQKIKTDVEKQIPTLRLKLSKDDYNSKDRIEFMIDTFRIEKITEKRMEMDYSTAGMNNAVGDLTTEYDKLLNKYYSQLVKIIKPEDKNTLIKAQRVWISYRDSEQDLINTFTDEKYTGGGTMYSSIRIGHYNNLVKERTITLFNYFDEIKNGI